MEENGTEDAEDSSVDRSTTRAAVPKIIETMTFIFLLDASSTGTGDAAPVTTTMAVRHNTTKNNGHDNDECGDGGKFRPGERKEGRGGKMSGWYRNVIGVG